MRGRIGTGAAAVLAAGGLLAAVVAIIAVSGGVHAAKPEVERPLPPEVRAERAKVRDVRGRWPKTIDEFVNGGYLRRADVVLTQREYDPVSFLIRWVTQSPFSHAALVFTTPQSEPGYSSAFVIEAGTSGVDLTDLKEYAQDKSAFLAIKRLKAEVFDDERRSRVRGMLLDNIKSDYSYGTILKILSNVWFGLERAMRGKDATIQSFDDRNWARPNEFICSGLVQFGFLEAAVEAAERGDLPITALRDVVFDPEVSELLQFDEQALTDREVRQNVLDLVVPQLRATYDQRLASLTPQDLAHSDKLEWLYFIKGGKVWQVTSQQDVERLNAANSR